MLSKNFGKSSSDLCHTPTKVTKKLSTEELSTSLVGLLPCRLIPLNKNPGLRPIGAGEVLRRIIGQVVVSVVHNDIIFSVGSLQVCAGYEAGCGTVIHAMHTIFEDEKTEAVLLVGAANAFNSVNRQDFLHNICFICSPNSHICKKLLHPTMTAIYYWRNLDAIIRRNHTGRLYCYVNIRCCYNTICFNNYGNYVNLFRQY